MRSVLVLLALVVAASGCLAEATAPRSSSVGPPLAVGVPPQAHAVFHIRGTYTTGNSTNHFAGDVHRYGFTLHCRSLGDGRLDGPVSWQGRLCMAILDYRTQDHFQGTACRCPASPVRVDVRGVIRGRPVHEHIAPCLCGDGRQAAADARIILRTHPQKSGDVTW